MKFKKTKTKMAPSSGELFGHHLMPTSIQVDCLLPNGVIIQLTCYRDSPLEKIKAELWREATNFPLYHLLKGKKTRMYFIKFTSLFILNGK